MQVAMRLGPYWWKQLGKKRVGEIEIRKWSIYIPIFLGITLVTSLIFLLLLEMKIITVDEIAKNESNPFLPIVVLAIAATIIITSITTITCLLIVGIASVKALIATLRFRTIFGFSPPVTLEGQKAIQLAVDRILAFRAIARAKEYSREEVIIGIIKEIEDKIRSNVDCDLQAFGKAIVMHETRLSELEKSKKEAEKNYYEARDAACNSFLPIPFEVKKSFQDYFYSPKKVA